MAHKEQRDFFLEVRNKFPEKFKGVKVLDIGSLDINGNNRHLFEDSDYTGLDVAEGNNVDVVSLAHEYNPEGILYDIIVSNDCFEHDMFYEKTFQNIVRLLKSGGMFLFTCKTTGSQEHGTLRSDGGFSSPLTIKFLGWENYYRNITEEDVRKSIPVDEIFDQYEFSVLDITKDIRFFGTKKGEN
jgi:SAM-dependent methyltransferase